MIATRIVRNAATTINIHDIGFEDLTNAMGEARLLLARLSIEKETRLNAKAQQDAQVIHNEEKQERDDFDKHVRDVVESKRC